MLKIRDDVDLKVLLKFGFKEVQQNKRVNYIYMPSKVWDNCGNSIRVNNDRNLFNMDYYIGEDRLIIFRLNELATEEFNKTMTILFKLIKADLIEDVGERREKMKLENAKERVKDLIRISEEGAFRYPNDSELFLNDKEALSLVLSELEKYKRLAEANLKDGELLANEMCNHRCIVKSTFEEYEECLEAVSKELGNVAYDQLSIAIAEIKAKNALKIEGKLQEAEEDLQEAIRFEKEAKTKEEATLWWTAQIRADERINVLKEMLKGVKKDGDNV